MSVAFIRSNFVRKVASVVCLCAFPLAAQQPNTSLSMQAVSAQTSGQPGAPVTNAPEPKNLPQPTSVDYSRPTPLLPNPFARYIPRKVPPPAFTNAPKMEQLIQNGKLLLSMNDAIAIALADNLDIAIARYNLPIADTDVLLTKAGGFPRGVNSGVVSNTPGGGFGGISGSSGAGAGGTTAGAGGAGAGANGIVGSTSGAGPQPDSFDPTLNGTFALSESRSLQNFGLLSGLGSGANLAEQHVTTGNLSFNQGFSPGTLLSVGVNNQRQSTNSPQTSFNPSITSSFTATVRQHLLQGFGRGLNTRLILQAKNNKKITEEGFRDQVISTVSQIETIYWDLVNAYEDMKVKERSLGLAQKTLSDNQKQVEIGTLAPLDVVRAQSTVASAEQDLIVSKTNLQLEQLIIKNALTRDLPNDSPLMQADVIPTDTVQIPDQENLPPVQDLIKQALSNRPDYNKLKINLQNSEINIKGANNGLLPTVDLLAFYGGSGLNGVPNRLNPANAGAPQTGFSDAFGSLFNSTAPDKGVQINIQIPIGNRAAEATQVRSLLELRQSQLNLKQVENQIGINVRNDAFTVDQNRARVAASQKARDLAAQTLDAEQKKYNLGASTYLAVLQDERDLAAAESALVTAMTNYAKARVQLDKDTAQTLDRNNIKLDESVTGQIRTQPTVPGTTPNATALQEPNAPPTQQQPSAQPAPAQQPPAQQPPAQRPPQ
ncbi:MAG TPA: TolC family protein [Candidatus Angelobacter sp.]|nr:TolC family protein [Candidatus Angelobacter sp.]